MSVSKSAIVLLAEGAEEIEFVTTVDVLRRAKVNVTVAGVPDNSIKKCSRGVSICPDKSLSEAANSDYDAIIIPGGLAGVKNLSQSEEVKIILKKQECRQGAVIAAICAGPLVLKNHRVALNKTITSYPSVKDELTSDFKYDDEKIVVIDGDLITSRGPGTAMDFALSIMKKLVGTEIHDEVKKGLIYCV